MERTSAEWWLDPVCAALLVPSGILLDGAPAASPRDVADHCAREAARIASETDQPHRYIAKCPGDPGFAQAVLHRVQSLEELCRAQGDEPPWELLDMRLGLVRLTGGRLGWVRFYVRDPIDPW